MLKASTREMDGCIPKTRRSGLEVQYCSSLGKPEKTTLCPFCRNKAEPTRNGTSSYLMNRRERRIAAPSRSRPAFPRKFFANNSISPAVLPRWSTSSNCARSKGIIHIRDSHRRTMYRNGHAEGSRHSPSGNCMYSSAIERSAISCGKNLTIVPSRARTL
jgi:hypothetical protein